MHDIRTKSVSKKRQEAEKAALKAKERFHVHKQQNALKRQKEFNERTKIWNDQILPYWDELADSSKVNELCLKGLPPNIRGKVWPLIIGNDLQITEELFYNLNQQVITFYSSTLSVKRSLEQNHDTGATHTSNKTNAYKTQRDSIDTIISVDSSFSMSNQPHAPTSLDQLINENSNGFEKPSEINLNCRSDDTMDNKKPFLLSSLLPRSISPKGRSISTPFAETTFRFRKPSSDIPIPKSGKKEKGYVDVTEEAWFENERRGSLDQQEFEFMHKQLFTRPDLPNNEEIESDSRKFSESSQKDRVNSKESNSPFPIDLESESEKEGLAEDTRDQKAVDHATRKGVLKSSSTVQDPSVKFDLKSSSTEATPELEGVVDSTQFMEDNLNSSGKLGVERASLGSTDAEVLAATNAVVEAVIAALVAEKQVNFNPVPSKYSLDKDASPQDTLSKRDEPQFNPGFKSQIRRMRSATDPEMEFKLFSNVNKEVDLDRSRFSSKMSPVCSDDFKPRPAFSAMWKEDKGIVLRSKSTPSGTSAGLTAVASILNELNSTSRRLGQLPKDQKYGQKSRSNSLVSIESGDWELSYKKKTLFSQLIVSDDFYFACDEVKDKINFSREEDEMISSSPSGLENVLRSGQSSLSPSRLTNSYRSSLADEIRMKGVTGRVSEEHTKLLQTMGLIEWDLPRTFPTLGFFHDGGPMHQGLERVLLCYACYRPDIGYVQGMSFLVAMLLLYMDEYEAFKCLTNLLNRRLNMDFFQLKKDAIDSYVACFDHFFKKFLPLLKQHFNSEGISSEMFLMDWQLSLFTKALPLELAAQIWDHYLREGEIYLLCAGLGLLKLYAAKLATLSVEQILPFLLHFPDTTRAEDVFKSIAQIQITKSAYTKIRFKTAEQNNIPMPDSPHLTRKKQISSDKNQKTAKESIRKVLRNSMKLTKQVLLSSGSKTQNKTPNPSTYDYNSLQQQQQQKKRPTTEFSFTPANDKNPNNLIIMPNSRSDSNTIRNSINKDLSNRPIPLNPGEMNYSQRETIGKSKTPGDSNNYDNWDLLDRMSDSQPIQTGLIQNQRGLNNSGLIQNQTGLVHHSSEGSIKEEKEKSTSKNLNTSVSRKSWW